jgi:hypothetical protein
MVCAELTAMIFKKLNYFTVLYQIIQNSSINHISVKANQVLNDKGEDLKEGNKNLIFQSQRKFIHFVL